MALQDPAELLQTAAVQVGTSTIVAVEDCDIAMLVSLLVLFLFVRIHAQTGNMLAFNRDASAHNSIKGFTMLVVWRCMHARLVASGNVYRKVPHNFRTVGQLILSSMMGKKKPSCRSQRHLSKCDVQWGERPSWSQVAESLAKRHFGWPRLRSFQPESQVCLVNTGESTPYRNCSDSPVVQKSIQGFGPQNDAMIKKPGSILSCLAKPAMRLGTEP